MLGSMGTPGSESTRWPRGLGLGPEPGGLQNCAQWATRALPAAEKRRLRWESIPRSGADSFAFEGEPMDLPMLEAEHARWPMPTIAARPDEAT
jgi:hypothetical protein